VAPVSTSGAAGILSVVIPVRNGAATLPGQLEALARATPPRRSLEVLVADNGSTDDTPVVVAAFASRLPVRWLDAGRAIGSNAARNRGVEAARGSVILLCDADDEVDTGWLAAMEEAFDTGHQLVAGPIDYTALNTPQVRAWRGAPRAGVRRAAGFLPAGHGANLGFTRRVVESVGGFDEDFVFGGPDIEFCWRAQLAGFVLHEQPDAIVHYRMRQSLRDLWRQSVLYGAAEAHLYRKFAASGMPRRSAGAVVTDLWWILTRLPFALPRARRGAWVRRAGTQWGRLVGSVRYRVRWV
jgi:GT2 family glycosyltransferase